MDLRSAAPDPADTQARPEAAPAATPPAGVLDRLTPGAPLPRSSPRSERDLEILRSLARRINPRDAGAHNNLGVVFYNKGLYEEAIEHFEKALELDPRMQVADRNLQIAYFHTGYYERLVSDLRAKLLSD